MQRRKIVYICLIVSTLLFGSGCARTNTDKVPGQAGAATIVPDKGDLPAPGKELLALADSQDEAEDIAEQYGISLVSFSNGVAVFHTEEKPQDVIDRGIANGWTTLSINNNNNKLF